MPAQEPAEQPFQRTSSQKVIMASSDVLTLAIPAAALGASLISRDWLGAKQFAFSVATAFGATMILKYAVKKERPDHSNFHSMNSGHSAISFASAAYIQRRYGWQWGFPAYCLATYVGWARIYSKKHDIWDVLAGAVIGAGSSYIYTRPFARKHSLAISPLTDGRNFIISASLTF